MQGSFSKHQLHQILWGSKIRVLQTEVEFVLWENMGIDYSSIGVSTLGDHGIDDSSHSSIGVSTRWSDQCYWVRLGRAIEIWVLALDMYTLQRCHSDNGRICLLPKTLF
jgi:hypothetical protein